MKHPEVTFFSTLGYFKDFWSKHHTQYTVLDTGISVFTRCAIQEMGSSADVELTRWGVRETRSSGEEFRRWGVYEMGGSGHGDFSSSEVPEIGS